MTLRTDSMAAGATRAPSQTKLASKTAALSDIRIPELDGVRAVAIWLVLIVHVVFSYRLPEGALAWLPSLIVSIFGHGWLGVDLFFVLSGFLITGILLDSKEHPHYFRRFYGRRVLRVFPVYFASIFVVAFFYSGSGPYFLLSSLFLANFAYIFAIPVPHGPGVLWSLAVEEHFYLVWPAVVRKLNWRTLTLLSLAIVLLSPVLRGIATSHGVPVDEVVYQLSAFRFDGLALGALLAIWVRSEAFNRPRSVQLIFGLLAADLLLTTLSAPFGGLGRATPVGVAIRFTQAQWFFAAGMLAILVWRDTLFTALFRTRFMTLSGELSYCIYLIHLSLCDAYMGAIGPVIEPALQNHLGPDLTLAIRVLTILLMLFGLAWLSRKFLEAPILGLKRYLD